jgi:predicted kinase
MKTLHVMVGLPRSGKTTWLANTLMRRYPVVSGDAIRLALHGKRFLPAAEYMVSMFMNYMIRALFIAGHENVVVDECAVTEALRKKRISRFWLTVFHVMNTPPLVCKNRAIKEKDQEILPVIDRMAGEWEDPTSDNLTVTIDPLPMPKSGGPEGGLQ